MNAILPPREPQPSGSPVTLPPGHLVTWSSFRVPREGRYWLALALGLLGMGLFRGMNLVLLLACLMLALWGLNALLAGRRLDRLVGERWIDGPVFAQTPCTVHLRITNPKAAPVPGVRIEDRGPGHTLAWYLPRLGGHETLWFRQAVTLPTRGRYAWEPLEASSGYPFGLVRRRRVLVPGDVIIVLPRPGRLHRGRLRHYLTPVGFYEAGTRDAARRHAAAQAEFHGLRAFRTGDSPRWIHWRTSARCGELMVREFEDVPNDDLVLIVDPGPPPCSPQDRAGLEAVISLAATVCWEWCRQRGDRLMLVVAGSEPVVLDGLTGPEHALRMLECLAVLTGRPETAATALPERLASLPLPRAPILLLSARPGNLGDLLAQRLNRPVAALDVSALPEIDFYEPPPCQTAQDEGKRDQGPAG
ncbi:MAG TPA: DUF58 domain-containing protein [Gemmataceae bacterium]|nr:DUF58 domain-containing protein [Gemmataceae bacterium]